MQIKTHSPLLQFQNPPDKLTDSLSAAVFVGDDLWVASDETTSVERLSIDDGLTFQHHKSFSLNGLIDLPAQGTQFDQEIDIEGLDFHDSHVWLIGSHSIKRKKVERTDAGADAKLIKKLGTIEKEGNRFILARIPVIKNSQTGERELVGESPPGSHPILKASRLTGDLTSDALSDAIWKAGGGNGDIHLARFLDIPGKDNGLDIEGLAVAGERVFLGLRGPVLRGWAVILELSVDTSNSSQLVLKEFEPAHSYRKHFLDLAGLGVRELSIQGSDLLVLAGPTMVLDGPTILYRWREALHASSESLVRGDRLTVEMEIPFGQGADHAEGIAIVPDAGPPSQVLVVYDSPGAERKKGVVDAVRADVFNLPAPRLTGSDLAFKDLNCLPAGHSVAHACFTSRLSTNQGGLASQSGRDPVLIKTITKESFMPEYSTKFQNLVNEYANMPIEFPELKDITVAQWILESGRGSSELAKLHNNFGGLKWRTEMAAIATPVHYVAHDGPDTYCAFASEEDFIRGYWIFIDRAPYKGWRDQAGSDETFIQFIGKIYAPAASSYSEQVLNLRAEARNLLGSGTVPDGGDDSHGTSEPHTKPPVKQFIQSPNRQSRNGVSISRVILHYTAGPSAKSAINTFLNDKGKKRVSAHYIVDKNGDIYQMVADNEMASHCKGANIDSIGIEHVAQDGDPLTPAQEASSVALVKWLLSAYKLRASAITGHNFAKGRKTITACPHSLFGKYQENKTAANEAVLHSWVQKHFTEFA